MKRILFSFVITFSALAFAGTDGPGNSGISSITRVEAVAGQSALLCTIGQTDPSEKDGLNEKLAQEAIGTFAGNTYIVFRRPYLASAPGRVSEKSICVTLTKQ